MLILCNYMTIYVCIYVSLSSSSSSLALPHTFSFIHICDLILILPVIRLLTGTL